MIVSITKTKQARSDCKMFTLLHDADIIIGLCLECYEAHELNYCTIAKIYFQNQIPTQL